MFCALRVSNAPFGLRKHRTRLSATAGVLAARAAPPSFRQSAGSLPASEAFAAALATPPISGSPCPERERRSVRGRKKRFVSPDVWGILRWRTRSATCRVGVAYAIRSLQPDRREHLAGHRGQAAGDRAAPGRLAGRRPRPAGGHARPRKDPARQVPGEEHRRRLQARPVRPTSCPRTSPASRCTTSSGGSSSFSRGP